MFFLRSAALVAALLCFASCSRDPKVLRQRQLETGNRYYDRGRYREASLYYRNAIKTDAKFGPAYYHLALVELKLQHDVNAIAALRRAIDLLPPGGADASDANVKLAERLLLFSQGTDREDVRKKLRDEIESIKAVLLKNNPNSFEGNKLQAELLLSEAVYLNRHGKMAESRATMDETIAQYRKSLQIKPGDPSAMLALGKTLQLIGELDESERIFKQVIDKDKTNIVAYTELYMINIAQRKIPEAESILKRAAAAQPSDFNLQTLLASHYYSVNNRPEMAKVLNNLKAHFKEFPEAYTRTGDFYFRIGDAEQALRQYAEGMQADKAHKIDYQKRIVEVLIRQGKTAQAYEKDLEILKENPKDPEARGLKASFLLDKGDVNDAAAELQSVVTAKPNNFVARFNLGRAYFIRGDLEQARQQFEEAVKLRPDYMPGRLALTQLALRRGDSEAALKYAQDTLKLNPASGVSTLLEAAALMRLGRFDESRERLDKILKTNPNQTDTLLEMGLLDIAQKRFPESEDAFRRAYAGDPTNLRGLDGLIQVEFLSGQPDKAVQAIAAEVQKQPQRADLRKLLAVTEMRVHEYGKGIEDLKMVLDKYKDSPSDQAEIYARMGEAYGRMGDVDNGVIYLKKARSLAPNSVLFISSLAQLYNEHGRLQEALGAYREAVKVSPNDPYALNNLAYLMAETGGNLDEALSLAQRAKQQLPTFYEVSDTIGWIYIKKNLSDSAVEIFRDLTNKVATNSTYHYHYAMALAQKGDRPNAIKQLKEALQYTPKKDEEGRIKDLMQKVS